MEGNEDTKGKTTNYWKSTLAILFVIILLTNTFYLVINLQSIQNPLEKPSLEPENHIQTINLRNLEWLNAGFSYFNYSIYTPNIYPNQNDSIIKLSFNTNFTNYSKIESTSVKINPNIQINGWTFTDFTTNGNQSYIIGEYCCGFNNNNDSFIYELSQPFTNNTYLLNEKLNLTCQIPQQFQSIPLTCSIENIKLIGNQLYILKYFVNSNNKFVGFDSRL